MIALPFAIPHDFGPRDLTLRCQLWTPSSHKWIMLYDRYHSSKNDNNSRNTNHTPYVERFAIAACVRAFSMEIDVESKHKRMYLDGRFLPTKTGVQTATATCDPFTKTTAPRKHLNAIRVLDKSTTCRSVRQSTHQVFLWSDHLATCYAVNVGQRCQKSSPKAPFLGIGHSVHCCMHL